uniref:Uncharacterized protein n=1 Tax=Anguilla anguilla TaxID=7936 RepID=A0A0E9X4B2_ANGAN
MFIRNIIMLILKVEVCIHYLAVHVVLISVLLMKLVVTCLLLLSSYPNVHVSKFTMGF